MKTKNYLTIDENNALHLHGFNEIKDFLYVEIFNEKKYLVFFATERPQKETRFKIVIEPGRIIKDERLLHLVREYGLESKRFLKDPRIKNYTSTDIDV